MYVCLYVYSYMYTHTVCTLYVGTHCTVHMYVHTCHVFIMCMQDVCTYINIRTANTYVRMYVSR